MHPAALFSFSGDRGTMFCFASLCLGWALVKCTGMRGCFKGPLGVRNPLGTVKGIAG